MDSPYQMINDLFGNGYWGESLLSVPGIFPGINSFGPIRRAVSAWLEEEVCLLETIPLVIILKLVFMNVSFLKNE